MSASGTLTQKTACQWWKRKDHCDAVHRADDAAEFLRGSHATEYRRAVTARPQVRGEREGDRKQRAACDALNQSADDKDVEVGGHPP